MTTFGMHSLVQSGVMAFDLSFCCDPAGQWDQYLLSLTHTSSATHKRATKSLNQSRMQQSTYNGYQRQNKFFSF